MAIRNALKYFQEVHNEFSRVVWPKFDDFIGSSVIVVIIMCAFSVYLGVIDISFSRLVHRIFSCWTC
jgi:preprotein translocase SecE subunit